MLELLGWMSAELSQAISKYSTTTPFLDIAEEHYNCVQNLVAHHPVAGEILTHT